MQLNNSNQPKIATYLSATCLLQHSANVQLDFHYSPSNHKTPTMRTHVVAT